MFIVRWYYDLLNCDHWADADYSSVFFSYSDAWHFANQKRKCLNHHWRVDICNLHLTVRTLMVK